MFKKTSYILIAVIALTTLLSCGKFNRILKSTNLDEKFKAGEAYYKKGDYFHARQLFEELIGYYRGTANAEKTYYYYAYCYYGMNDYTSAAYYFKTFCTTFPHSKYARETQFLSAYCTYMDSPDYTLDQTNTINAIKELQLFVNMHPASDTVGLCNKLIDDLRLKLETKEFETAKLYYKIQDYKAAIIAFRNTLKDYPDTKSKEECMYYMMKSAYLLAVKSVESKKQERYKSAVDAYEALIQVYPQSKYLKEAELINKNSIKELSKINIKS